MSDRPSSIPGRALSSSAESVFNDLLGNVSACSCCIRDDMVMAIDHELSSPSCCPGRQAALEELRCWAMGMSNREIILMNIKRILDEY
jgi:hypothetical protein